MGGPHFVTHLKLTDSISIITGPISIF